ncbi:hypothetical protein HPB52_022319 [Rhipicephalus sanguineus]|uniref:Uncharacterized protein n=1 Tax=Rhipicephalus sanguineus TaxID=34632 RepID=A0A9D4Q3G7_RHISA|nr:hypothetical protein HPB52_022319 [Rhipicephalus sanguineus]
MLSAHEDCRHRSEFDLVLALREATLATPATPEDFAAVLALQPVKGDSSLSLRSYPGVLVCGTCGVGSKRLAETITRLCSHAVYTGQLTLDQDERGRHYLYAHDEDAFQDFLKVKGFVKRYVSLPLLLLSAVDSPAVKAASRFVADHALRGAELAVRSDEDVARVAAICRGLHKIHSDDISLLVKIAASIQPTTTFLKNISTLADAVIFETQRLRGDVQLHSIRFANPYMQHSDAAVGDVFMRQQLSRIWSLRQQLVTQSSVAAQGWCFTLSLGAIKNYVDTLYKKLVFVTGYDYTSLQEVCALLRENKAQTNNDSVSRFVKTDYVFYTFDDRDSIAQKCVVLHLQMSRALREFPELCVAGYDVELDDLDGYCDAQGADVGAPLLEVLHAVAFRHPP